MKVNLRLKKEVDLEKMKISYGSDIHIEFGQFKVENTNNADILVLAGDICVDSRYYSTNSNEFFEQCSNEFETVLYVLGNHEYYRGDISSTLDSLKTKLSEYPNIFVMEDSVMDFPKFRILGSTLWTDINNEDPITEITIRRSMNDFSMIRGLTIDKFKLLHYNSLEFLKNNLREDRNIVISHHAPSQMSISDQFKDEYHMNGAYRTNLEEFITNSNITEWIHGHTHHSVDYFIGKTRVLSNQRGYIGHEAQAYNFNLKTIEV
jgi:Icc-related predicted phosphoesterase